MDEWLIRRVRHSARKAERVRSKRVSARGKSGAFDSAAETRKGSWLLCWVRDTGAHEGCQSKVCLTLWRAGKRAFPSVPREARRARARHVRRRQWVAQAQRRRRLVSSSRCGFKRLSRS